MDFESVAAGIVSALPGLEGEAAVAAQAGVGLALQLLAAVVLFVIGWWISKWAHRTTLGAVQARNLDLALGRFLAALVQWSVVAAAVITALQSAGIEIGGLLALFASAGIAIGLALQGSLSHFASGVMLLIFRPFTIGDWVSVAGSSGTVHEIGLFATTLITPDNQKVIIPNSSITSGTIVNSTTLGTRRADVVVGVAYGEDPERVREILLKAIRSCELALGEPDPAVAFTDLGASALEFKCMGWANSADWWPLTLQIREAVYRALEEAGVEIPFDQVVVHRADTPAEAAAK